MVKIAHYAFILLIVAGLVTLSFLTAEHVANSDKAIELVEQFGILGIIIVAFIGGLNLIVPIPVATLTPIFEAANFSLPTIIMCLVIGTTIADTVGYGIARLGSHASKKKFPQFQKKLRDFSTKHHKLILPGVFVWAVIVPLPNETILVPLGLMGYKLRLLLLPLIFGTILHQTLYVLGISNIFTWLMG
jgi:membrane protein DedA with SNARE-associated domain